MKNNKLLSNYLILFILGFVLNINAQNNISVDAADNWVGYMNVFDMTGNYQFGSGWGVSDLKTTLDLTANNITLQPNFNTYADNPGDPYWQNGAIGNKLMEASTYVEPGATFNGTDLTFSGEVVSNTLDAALYTAKYFIKALDPAAGYSDVLGGSATFDLPLSGSFSVTVPAASLTSGLIVQYGFMVNGINANPADEAALGSVVVSSASTPPPSDLIINTEICGNTGGSDVRLTGPFWGWDPAAGPIAADNGNGTYTFLLSPAPTTDMEFLLVFDGVQEDLVAAGTSSGDWSCTPVTDYATYANRLWVLGSGDVNNVYGQCGPCSNLSISEDDNLSFVMYPNPAFDILNINFHKNVDALIIRDLLGKVIVINDNVLSNNITLNISEFSSNVYFVEVYKDLKVETKKLIIVR